MPRSDVERLMEAIDPVGYHVKDPGASAVRALLRAAERMHKVLIGPELTPEWLDAAVKYEQAKAHILGGKT